MYYTNVDLYANLKQLRGLCRQEFDQCSPVLFPTAASGRGSGRLVGAVSSRPRTAGGPADPRTRLQESSRGETQRAPGSGGDVASKIQLLPPQR